MDLPMLSNGYRAGPVLQVGRRLWGHRLSFARDPDGVLKQAEIIRAPPIHAYSLQLLRPSQSET